MNKNKNGILQELQPNPLSSVPTPKFKRSFIYPTDYLPTEILSTLMNAHINNYERNDMYSLMLEVPLTPKLHDKVEHTPRIISAIWSPWKLAHPSKCLLATLTSAGAFDLSFKSGKNWFSVCNLSSLWWETIKNDIEFDPAIEYDDDNSISADKFVKNARRLQATSIAWSSLQQDSNGFYCFFVSVFRSGDLAVWKINQAHELSFKVEAILVYKTLLDTVTGGDTMRISKIAWLSLGNQKHLVILGYFDGQIHAVQFNYDNISGEMTQVSTLIYNGVFDKMPVTLIKTIKSSSGHYFIIIIKSFFYILLVLNEEGELVQSHHLKIKGFSITGNFFFYFYSLWKRWDESLMIIFFVPGLVVLNETETVVSCQNSSMYLVKFTNNLLTSTAINQDKMNKSTKIQYLGLTCSPSTATFINITSPNIQHDHLMNREPSVIQLFHFNNKNPWSILDSSKSNLNIHWDCLELIRIKAAKAIEPEDYLPNVDKDLKSLESLTIHRLRVIMWLTLIKKLLNKKKIIKKIDNIVGEISEARPLIFINSASNYLLKLSNKKCLNDNNRLAINFLRLYLEVHLAGEDVGKNIMNNNLTIKKIQEAIEKTSNIGVIEVESCSLCGEIITELPWITSNCPRGHKLPRCALTLLQITSLKYKSCPICGRIYHPSLDDEFEPVCCLYCDIPVIYDSRIIGVDDDIHENCKNLSVKPAWEIQASRLPQENS